MDSVRLFVQIDSTLVSIDVQGMASVMDALAVAVDLAELQMGCTIDGDCAVPGGIGQEAT